MATKAYQRKLTRHRIYLTSCIAACLSFIMLAFIATSSLVRAMSLDHVPEENGIPTAWELSTIHSPDTITLPIAYWDQRVDACDDTSSRQFEWGRCFYWTKGALQGIVKPTLGDDHLPIPAFSTSEASWVTHHDIFTANVTGHDPVLPTDNFYRWFHEVDGLSRRITGRTVTFTRTGHNTYVYGGQHIYPLDDIPGFNANDVKLRGADGAQHNFHFTGHLRIGMRIAADGQERFHFSGDDDVWVFLNNQLVLDIGGLHEPLGGWFTIDADGLVHTHVNSVSNVADRTDELTNCMKNIQSGVNQCNANFNNFLVAHNQPADDVLDLGLKAGDVVYLDFFYAERSSDGSNTKITIENMDWPIPADTNLVGEIVQETETSNIIEFKSSLTNRDPENMLRLERLASHITDTAKASDAPTSPDNLSTPAPATSTGFLPLDHTTLWYTATPDDPDSWTPVELSAPANDATGFTLATPLTLAPAGSNGDTLYFRYYAETLSTTGTIKNTISYYTNTNNVTRIVHNETELPYARTIITPPDNPDPETPTPDNPENPDPVTPDQPVAPFQPTTPNRPGSDIIDDNLTPLDPLGEVVYVPNTGLIDSLSSFFTTDFATIILSQSFIMVTLFIFAASFAAAVNLHAYRQRPVASKNSKASKNSPKSKNR